MKMYDMLKQVERMFQEMEHILQKAKVPKRQLRKLRKEMEDVEKLPEVRVWLGNLYFNEFEKCRLARKCVTEDMWENYKLMGIKDLQEQNLWNTAVKKLLGAFEKRYPTVSKGAKEIIPDPEHVAFCEKMKNEN